MKLVVKRKSELLPYLEAELDMPKKKIKSYLVHGMIDINHQKVTQYNFPLEVGMKIEIDTKTKKQLPFTILYEDNFILVVDKPSNLLTIATSKEKEKTLYHYVREYVKSKNKNNKIFVVHRLDRDTSGIVLFAKDEKTKNDFQKNWNTDTKNREYIAIVHGIMEKKSDCLVNRLLETKTNHVYVTEKKEGKEAITNYQVIKESNLYSMLKIKIETGRKNQIRVQLANINHPIVGDKKYSKKKREETSSRLYLHASKLQIFYKQKKDILTLESKLPDSFHKFIRK